MCHIVNIRNKKTAHVKVGGFLNWGGSDYHSRLAQMPAMDSTP